MSPKGVAKKSSKKRGSEQETLKRHIETAEGWRRKVQRDTGKTVRITVPQKSEE
jgi:hypothetical protein